MKHSFYQHNYKLLTEEILDNPNISKLNNVEYNKGDFLIHEGDVLDSMIFILHGKIKIYQNYENGKTLLLQIMDEFTVLGDIEYFLKRNAECSVEAMSHIEAIKISYSEIDRLYKKNVTFLNQMICYISNKLLRTNKYASINLMYPLETRLASYLLSMCNISSIQVTLPNLTDLANQLGASYRHLERTFKKLEDELIIIKDNKNILILNKERLLEIGRGNIYEREDEKIVHGK
ncbi:Crp/Fnr family transcriptional regulator [Candidatus Izemoplasma sp. B36]|uniref:Crp/Fnr family transcriptional regulator n=1 Tax=Candidatus Izemoplasma sp. B36 TaxID=3242468 RepID=UPI003556AD7B